MSVFICSDYHIDLLASAISWYVPRSEWPQGYGITHTSYIANILLKENVSSFSNRYQEDVDISGYEFRQVDIRNMTIGYIWKQVDCYMYQSCESFDWEISLAKRFCDALRANLKYKVAGYGEAPWGVCDDDRVSDSTGPISIMDMIPKKR